MKTFYFFFLLTVLFKYFSDGIHTMYGVLVSVRFYGLVYVDATFCVLFQNHNGAHAVNSLLNSRGTLFFVIESI